MGYLLLGVGALGLFLAFAQMVTRSNPTDLARHVKTVGGVALLVLAVVFLVVRRIDLAMLAAGGGLTLLGLRGARGFRPAGNGSAGAGAGQVSIVRSAYFEMCLDHESGTMTGEVLAGRFEGRALDGVSRAELVELYRETAADGDSRALLEAYLDRREPGWRVDFDADATAGHRPAPGTGAMTEQEAYQVLGLAPGAGEAEIRAAHRRLMKRLHPDQGGSGFLAAKLNEAKDLLLDRH